MRLKRNITYGNVKIPKTSKGVIRKVRKKFLSTEYDVLWLGKHLLTMQGSNDFVQSQVAEGGVHKE